MRRSAALRIASAVLLVVAGALLDAHWVRWSFGVVALSLLLIWIDSALWQRAMVRLHADVCAVVDTIDRASNDGGVFAKRYELLAADLAVHAGRTASTSIVTERA